MCYTFIYKDQNNKIKIQSIPDNSNNFIHLLNKKQSPYIDMCLSSDSQSNKTSKQLIWELNYMLFYKFPSHF